MRRYVWRDLVRNPRRTLASLVGVTLGIALFSAVLFFIDGSRATMTQRALAPLALDMQRVLTAPVGGGLRFEQQVLGSPVALRGGQTVTIALTVSNRDSVPANEVVVNDEPPPPLRYEHGTTRLNGRPLADTGGQSPLAQGLARTGKNLGTVGPGKAVRLTYVARAARAVPALGRLRLQGTISTRENVVPTRANAATAIPLEQLQRAIAKLPACPRPTRCRSPICRPGRCARAPRRFAIRCGCSRSTRATRAATRRSGSSRARLRRGRRC
ncbi:MAG TPA: hypothetical protein VFY45_21745 [Baekduia sp.]|nr:hypothetical protein [Baekduia sp.]